MRTLALLLCLMLVLAGPALADEAETLFNQANKLAEKGDAAGALVLYRKALALEPDRPSLLYNAGMAAYLSGASAESVALFQRFRKADPADWRGLAKLIQAYQAAGDAAAVETSIQELRAWWKRGDNADLSKQRHFVRDQLVVGGDRVFVFEPFAPGTGVLRRIWDFVLVGADQRPKRVYYVELDTATTEMVRANGRKDAEMYFFDVNDERGHSSFGAIEHRPTYAEALARMKDIMAGKVAPVSSTRRDK